jgi:fructose-1,6-bisphosphatase I
MPAKIGMTLDEFIILKEKDYPNATGGLSKLMRDIGLSAKFINREVRNAGLNDIIGAVGTENIQGEQVQKLDLIANDILIKCLKNGGACAGIASEENETFIEFTEVQCKNAKYVVLFDPLDGSSNIDICAPIGTIFSIYKRVNKDHIDINDFTQNGTNVVGAGYIIYGSSTMMVYSTGSGVHGFTLDSSIGEFCLTHIDIKTPKINNIYSINQGSVKKSDQNIQDYASWCLEIDKPSNRPYSLRYIGSMVADFHRNLIKGGVFIYYSTSDAPSGKLRLLYECIPMAYIQEQAGGKASSGSQRILEVQSFISERLSSLDLQIW